MLHGEKGVSISSLLFPRNISFLPPLLGRTQESSYTEATNDGSTIHGSLRIGWEQIRNLRSTLQASEIGSVGKEAINMFTGFSLALIHIVDWKRKLPLFSLGFNK